MSEAEREENMSTRNSVQLIGYYYGPGKGKAPMYREGVGDGKSSIFAKISVRRPYKDKESGKYIYDPLTFTAFGHNADFLNQYAHEGDVIKIDAELQLSKPFTRKDGTQVNSEKAIIVNSVDIISSKEFAGESHSRSGAGAAPSSFLSALSGKSNASGGRALNFLSK